MKITLAMCLLLGVGYVLVLRGVSALAGPNGGQAETLTLDGRVVGAANVGQQFTGGRYFWGRPSAVDYNGGGSGGSNKATTNPEYLADVEQRGVEISGGTDLVSGYVWRGVWEAGVSLQPTLALAAGNFSVTAWGSVDFATTSYKEMDLTRAYALGPVTFSLADLYWEGGAGDRGTISRNYFRFGADSPHRVEAGIAWCISPRVPLTLAWNTVLFGAADVDAAGDRAYATYIEASYPFAVKGIDMKAGVGVVPWNAVGTYGIDRDFYVQNVFVNAAKGWTVAGSLQLGLFTSLSWNPAAQDVNFVGGISFRM